MASESGMAAADQPSMSDRRHLTPPPWVVAVPPKPDSRLPFVHPRDETYIFFRHGYKYECWLCDVVLSKEGIATHTQSQLHLSAVEQALRLPAPTAEIIENTKQATAQWAAERAREKYPDHYRQWKVRREATKQAAKQGKSESDGKTVPDPALTSNTAGNDAVADRTLVENHDQLRESREMREKREADHKVWEEKMLIRDKTFMRELEEWAQKAAGEVAANVMGTGEPGGKDDTVVIEESSGEEDSAQGQGCETVVERSQSMEETTVPVGDMLAPVIRRSMAGPEQQNVLQNSQLAIEPTELSSLLFSDTAGSLLTAPSLAGNKPTEQPAAEQANVSGEGLCPSLMDLAFVPNQPLLTTEIAELVAQFEASRQANEAAALQHGLNIKAESILMDLECLNTRMGREILAVLQQFCVWGGTPNSMWKWVQQHNLELSFDMTVASVTTMRLMRSLLRDRLQEYERQHATDVVITSSLDAAAAVEQQLSGTVPNASDEVGLDLLFNATFSSEEDQLRQLSPVPDLDSSRDSRWMTGKRPPASSTPVPPVSVRSVVTAVTATATNKAAAHPPLLLDTLLEEQARTLAELQPQGGSHAGTRMAPGCIKENSRKETSTELEKTGERHGSKRESVAKSSDSDSHASTAEASNDKLKHHPEREGRPGWSGRRYHEPPHDDHYNSYNQRSRGYRGRGRGFYDNRRYRVDWDRPSTGFSPRYRPDWEPNRRFPAAGDRQRENSPRSDRRSLSGGPRKRERTASPPPKRSDRRVTPPPAPVQPPAVDQPLADWMRRVEETLARVQGHDPK